jgi:Glycosyltransferases, probably involved in cell wall biogenesis
MPERKRVSVIIPFLNEELYIGACLESIAAQDYGKEYLQITALDGGSTDSSRKIAEEFASKNDIVLSILENPGRIASGGLNIGIRRSRAEYILILGAHAAPGKNYISRCVDSIEKERVDAAGGKVLVTASGFVAKVFSLARSSPLGGSILPHRYSQRPSLVRTAAYAVYKREVFDKIGLFDEALVHNQDEEFNWRMVKNGLKIYFDPEAIVRYYQNRNLGGFVKQFFRYGFWKASSVLKDPRIL